MTDNADKETNRNYLVQEMGNLKIVNLPIQGTEFKLFVNKYIYFFVLHTSNIYYSESSYLIAIFFASSKIANILQSFTEKKLFSNKCFSV